jgi:putative ABC transport system permease protein
MLRLLRLLSTRRPRGRAVLAVAGIALGVALAYGVHLVNGAAIADLAASVRELSGEADIEVRAAGGGFPESLYPAIARLPGVAWARPGLELDAALADGKGAIRVAGIDAVREGRPALLKADSVLLTPAVVGRARDGKLRLLVGQHPVELEVAGTVEMKGAIALTDVSTAQWRLGRLGELNRIDVRIARGADREGVLRSVAAALPPGVHASFVEALEEASSYPSRAYRVNLNVLAMVALVTGGFLVFSGQALEMARRRGEHALLRTLGLTCAGIARLALLEAALLGLAGAALGLALGYGLAGAALRVFGADLGAGAFRGIHPEVSFSPGPAAAYFLAGVAMAVLGAWLPARDAAASPPARALKAGDEQAMFASTARAWPGLVLLAAGAALAQLGPVGGLPLFGYAAIGCVLVGAVALMPVLSGFAFRLLRMRRPPWLLLAASQLRGAPGQAAVSLAAIVASFSLMVAMVIMVASFRQSLDAWLDAVLPAELYARTPFAGDTAYLAPGFEERLATLPQVARADFLRTERIVLDPARPPVVLIARDHAEQAYPLTDSLPQRGEGDVPPIWVSEALSNFEVGKTVEIPLNGKQEAFVVAGVFRDYARQHGALLIERRDYIALTGDRRANDAALWLASGATVAEAMEAVRKLPGGEQVELAEPGEIRRLSLRIFDRSFSVTYALEAVAVLVGLIGLSSSLGALVLARRREFGVLRHLGLTRREIGAMLAAEGGLLALLGAAAGLAAGSAMGVILVRVVNKQSFSWSMELHFPVLFVSLLVLVLFALSVLTAWLSSREATGMGPVRAVREDW